MGFISDKPSEENYDRFLDLLYLSSERGTDATGVCVVTNDKVQIDKAPIEAAVFIKEKLPKWKDKISVANICIGHTRKWTVGKPQDNNNNHPIESKNWVMVHNGSCTGMDRIKEYKYNGEVDSEVLLSHIEQFGIQNGISHLGWGSAGVALIKKDDTSRIILFRHNEPIYVGYSKKDATIFFASSDDILDNATANLFQLFSQLQIKKLPEDYVYELSHSPLNGMFSGRVEVKRTGHYYNSSVTCVGTPSHQYKNPDKGSDKEQLYWDDTNQIWASTEVTEKIIDTGGGKAQVSNKFFFRNFPSSDFRNWNKIPALSGSGHSHVFLSIDGEFIKAYNKPSCRHFLMTTKEAAEEKIIDL